MNKFPQALAIMMKNDNVLRNCSKIEPITAKSLFRKSLKIKEVSSGIIFDAFVIDYCSEDQHGIIISLDKKVALTLNNKKKCGPAEHNPNKRKELDLRDIHSGKDFEILAINN